VVGVDFFAAKIKDLIAYYVKEDNAVHGTPLVFTFYITLPSANSEVATDTAPIFQVLKAFCANDVAAFKLALDKMDETYFKPHERRVACPSLRWGLCHYLATMDTYGKKIRVMKSILEIDHEQCELAFEAEYDNLKRKSTAKYRVNDESGSRVWCHQERDSIVFPFGTIILEGFY
jgi:hypothetical protein